MLNTPLPIGFDDFKEIITGKYYYVDKSWFIKELLDQKAKVNLFTRPRRFGKTLNLSMLRYYFERTENKEDNRSLFDGLKIMQAGRQYTQEMGQYPVIMLTLKSAKQGTYEYAYTCLCEAIANEYDRHKMIISALEYADKDKFNRIRNQQGGPGDYLTSLAFLSKCLYTYYEKPAVILIDEYLVGILANLKDYLVKSNGEGGTGRYDICIYHLDETIPPVVIELKIARTFADMEKRAREALNQIEEKQYDAWLPDEGYTAWNWYGIAFYKKKCMIKMERKKILSYSDSF